MRARNDASRRYYPGLSPYIRFDHTHNRIFREIRKDAICVMFPGSADPLEPNQVSCSLCGEPTSAKSGECGPCTGDIGTVCRVCFAPFPGPSWCDDEPPPDHLVEHGRHAGIECPGSSLPVAICDAAI